MSAGRLSMRRMVSDHFEPDEELDPKVQRQLRGHLEQIDYAAYDANKKVMSAALSVVDTAKFRRMALATAAARTQWVAAGIAMTEGDHIPSIEEVEKLARLRCAYDELSEVYNAMRRMVERGYVSYAST